LLLLLPHLAVLLQIAIVLEYMDGGTLADVLKKVSMLG
jgi:hypothetical protein